jgi:F420H(2)-dependent quinone reductase
MKSLGLFLIALRTEIESGGSACFSHPGVLCDILDGLPAMAGPMERQATSKLPQEEASMSTTQRLRRLIYSMAASRAGLRMAFIFVRLVDMPISRLTGGKFIPSATGGIMPIYFLTTLGARSQKPRSQPVLCVPDDGKLILVGSNWGNSSNPGWVYNLRAHPRARVSKGSLVQAVTARELSGEERLTYWQRAVAFYPLYIAYARRSGRTLPVFLLEP